MLYELSIVTLPWGVQTHGWCVILCNSPLQSLYTHLGMSYSLWCLEEPTLWCLEEPPTSPERGAHLCPPFWTWVPFFLAIINKHLQLCFFIPADPEILFSVKAMNLVLAWIEISKRSAKGGWSPQSAKGGNIELCLSPLTVWPHLHFFFSACRPWDKWFCSATHSPKVTGSINRGPKPVKTMLKTNPLS